MEDAPKITAEKSPMRLAQEFNRISFEIGKYEREILSLRAEKAHCRRWINEHKRMVESAISWRDRRAAALQVKTSLTIIARDEHRISKNDTLIERWELEIAKLKGTQA